MLVTGAGRGLGRAIAVALADAGFGLLLTSRTPAHLAETEALCRTRVPTRSRVVDVRDEEQVRALASLLDGQEDLHAVVNNAGVGAWSPIEHLSLASWDEQLNCNLRGAFLVTRATLPYLRRQRRGLYVNLASDCALVGMAERAAYTASKFGLAGLTVTVRAEAQADGVHACLVYLGKTDTYFRGLSPGSRPDALDPGDVARAIAFVISSYPQLVVGELSLQPANGALSGPRSLL